MRTFEGEAFDIPEGLWRHTKKSYEWENWNVNTAKNKVGSFKEDRHYLRWDSEDGSETLFMEVKELLEYRDSLYVRHRSGLEYWFDKEVDDGKIKKTSRRRYPATGNGRRNKKGIREILPTGTTNRESCN